MERMDNQSQLRGKLLEQVKRDERMEVETPPTVMVVEVSPNDPNFNLIASYRSPEDPSVKAFNDRRDDARQAVFDATT